MQFDRLRIVSLPDVTPVNLLITQHRDILSAVIRGNADRAEKAIRTHVGKVLRIADGLVLRYPELTTGQCGDFLVPISLATSSS